MSGQTIRGTLRRAKNSKTWLLVRPDGKELQIPHGAVSSSLWPLDRKASDGMAVDYDLENGQPRRIRLPGEDWIPPASSEPPTHDVRSHPSRGGARQPHPPRGGSASAGAGGTRDAAASPPREYHNPYNFVPAPPRDGITGDLGDGRPLGHHRYHPDRWTGCIRVRMHTVTPLLLPDAQRACTLPGADDHRSYPVRMVGGKPYVPPTSVKGMLRAAYEAVTNSRFGVFGKEHQAPLAYRADAQTGLRLVPARIEEDGKGGLRIRLLPGTSEIDKDGRDHPMYAAWLPRYNSGHGGISARALKYPDNTLPKHGEEVRVWLEKVQHYRWDNKTQKHIADFSFWRVTAIARVDQRAQRPSPLPKQRRENGKSYYEPLGEQREEHGYVCVTNQNINRKHDERVFFVKGNHSQSNSLVHPLTEALRKQWKNLISNYRGAHDEKKEIWGRNGGKAKPWDYLGPTPGKTAWSRHLYVEQAEALKAGDLCYAEVKPDGGRFEVLSLYPVTISRRLFAKSPWDLLPQSLRPAGSLDELSPADRVFGWVRDGADQGGAVAWRGCLRVGPVTCGSDDPVLGFSEKGLPLAILGQPKPQQFRFYAAADQRGAPLPARTLKEQAYTDGQGLRGRKVYPHHADLPEDHWTDLSKERAIRPGWYQEYRRPEERRDSQNRSIGGWVKPGTVFEFEIHVENLSEVEMGALLWLLSDEVPHHRLGGGKPLGFGSVQLSIESTDLHCGDTLRKAYLSLEPSGAPPPDDQARRRESLIEHYKKAVEQAYGNGSPFDRIPFIAAFLQAARGFEDRRPIHYPRTTGRRAPDPGGEGYRWFVSNEKKGGPRMSLPALLDDNPGLPYLADR